MAGSGSCAGGVRLPGENVQDRELAVANPACRRTHETAAPLARSLNIKPTALAIRRGELPAHIAEVVAHVRKASGIVLVVGHSNTVPDIVAALSSSKPAKLCETTFANLFVVTPSAPQGPALQLKYGKADVAPASDCQ